VNKSLLTGILLIAVVIETPKGCSLFFSNLGFISLADASLTPASAVTLEESARDSFSRSVKSDLGNASAFRGYGELYRLEGNYKEAVDSLSKALLLGADQNKVTLWRLGKAYAGLGQIDLAVAAWRRAGAADYFLEEGKRYLHKGGSNCAGAEHSLRLAIMIDPQLADTHYALGQTLQCLGKEEEAADAFREAVRWYKMDSPLRYLAQGHALRYSGHWDEAVQAYQMATTLAKGDVYANIEAHLALSEVLYRKKGKMASAISCLEELIDLKLSDITPYILIGDIYLDQKRFAEARDWYGRARQVDPLNMVSNLYTLRAYVEEGNFLRDRNLNDSEKAFRAALAIDPRSAYARIALGWFLYLMRHDASRAAEEFKTAITLAPADSSAYTLLGYVYFQEGRLAEAIEVLNTALVRNPRDAEAHACIGTAYLRQGAMDVAVKELETAVTLAPQVGRYYEMLGDGYRGAGHRDKAIAAYRRALALEPGRIYSQHELENLLTHRTGRQM
jgi:tetratricopeptide (TPR) repeat protein